MRDISGRLRRHRVWWRSWHGLYFSLSLLALSGCVDSWLLPVDPDRDGKAAEEGDCGNAGDEGDEEHTGPMPEVCNEKDDDCDGLVDEDQLTKFYRDVDGDGFGVRSEDCTGCLHHTKGTVVGKDCNVKKDVVYSEKSGDCNDNNSSVYPKATEVCNNMDDNCNGEPDDGASNIYYTDADGDAYGDPNKRVDACKNPSGAVTVSGDCDDSVAAVNPGATEVCNNLDDDCDNAVDEGTLTIFYLDHDGDGFGVEEEPYAACSPPPGYADEPGDCDEGDPLINPGAPELCNGRDDNCDGSSDEGLKFIDYYLDKDMDGVGGPGDPRSECSQPSGFSDRDDDCNDSDPHATPLLLEFCDGIDNDCDGTVDEPDSGAATDADGDSYQRCPKDGGQADCDDSDPSIYPGALETCNSVDDDCDAMPENGNFLSIIDEGPFDDNNNGIPDCWESWMNSGGDDSQVWGSWDQDGDHLEIADGDCDDFDESVYPFADEVCDGLDNDCDGGVDETAGQIWYYDGDRDGYGNKVYPLVMCAQPQGYVSGSLGDDCDDSKVSVYPGAREICNDIDDDCNGQIDELYACVLAQEGTIGAYASVDGSSVYGPEVPVLTSVQAALDLAPDGSLVVVGPGTYHETIDFNGKAVRVVGWQGASQTVIDAGRQGSVVSFVSGEGADSILEGVTLTGGSAAKGGGVYVESSSPGFHQVVVTANEATKGGGIYVEGGAPELRNLQVTDNSATLGGGLFIASGSAPELTYLWISANRASSYGGGVYAYQVDSSAPTAVLLHHGIVEGNVAAEGGGVFLQMAEGSLSQMVVAGNAADTAAGIRLILSARITLERSIVAFNSSTTGAANLDLASALETYDTAQSSYNMFYLSDGSSGVSPVLSSTDQVADPGFLFPLDAQEVNAFHIELGGAAANAGPPAGLNDADGSQNDLGAYGGPDGAGWDLDGDGYPWYFWPGELADAPLGTNSQSFDRDDLNPAAH